jgi:hypothetical protein
LLYVKEGLLFLWKHKLVRYAGFPGAKTKFSQPIRHVPLVGLDGKTDVMSVSEEDCLAKLSGHPTLKKLLKKACVLVPSILK